MNYRKQRWSKSGALKYHKYVIDYGAARAASFQAVVVVVGDKERSWIEASQLSTCRKCVTVLCVPMSLLAEQRGDPHKALLNGYKGPVFLPKSHFLFF